MKKAISDKNTIVKLKKNIITTAFNAQEGHIPSAFSIIDIIWVIYKYFVTKKKPSQFLLSKGQGCLALYAVLAEIKLINWDELIHHYCSFESTLGGHPDRTRNKEVLVSTGSLGHGLPMAVGLCMSNRLKNNQHQVICLIGDGEANEGSVWEAALLASHHCLNRLYCIVDYNHSTDRAINMGNIGNKFKAFGWKVISINGHDHQQIYTALKNKSKTKPTCIIANTIKGKGCISMENEPSWHHRSPSSESEYNQLISELE